MCLFITVFCRIMIVLNLKAVWINSLELREKFSEDEIGGSNFCLLSRVPSFVLH